MSIYERRTFKVNHNGTTRFSQEYRPTPIVYQEGNHTIIHSAFEDAPVLAQADVALFDTPAVDDNCTLDEYVNWTAEIFCLLDKHLTRNAGLILIPRDRKGHPFLKSVATAFVAQSHGWEIFRQYIWVRGGDFHRAHYPFCPIFALRREGRPTVRTSPIRYKDILRVPNVSGYRESVVGEIPVDVAEQMISLFALPPDVVLDPFAGSGSTAEACHRLGLRSISIELDQTRAREICQRIQSLPERKE